MRDVSAARAETSPVSSRLSGPSRPFIYRYTSDAVPRTVTEPSAESPRDDELGTSVVSKVINGNGISVIHDTRDSIHSGIPTNAID